MWGFWTLCRNDNTIGTGHIRRCLTLAKHIAAKNEKVCFIINNNEYAIELLKRNRLPYYIDEHITQIPDKFFNFLFLDIYNGFDDKEFIKEQLRLSQVSIGITDYYKKINLNCDISIYTSESISIEKHTDTNFIIGAKYFIADSKFYSYKKIFAGRIKNILITFGGYDPFNVTQKVISSILHSPHSFKDYHFNILLGSMYPYKNELIESLENSKLQYKIYKDIENIALFYNENDFVITAGGNTFYEISIMGIPSLVISQNARQHNALTSLQSSLKMKYIGFYENLLIETIGNELYLQICNSESLANNSKSCLDFFNVDGKEMIYKKIMEYEK